MKEWLKDWISKRDDIQLEEFIGLLSDKTIEHIKVDLGVTSKSGKINHYVFTDGNCKNNGKMSAEGAYGVFFPDNIGLSSVGISDATNQKAELSAFVAAFETIQNNISFFMDVDIIVCSDSIYSINCMTKWLRNWESNGWKTSKGQDVKNKDLIYRAATKIQNIKDSGIKISFQHVFSHKPEPKDKNSHQHFLWYGNNKVDTMINEFLLKNKTNTSTSNV